MQPWYFEHTCVTEYQPEASEAEEFAGDKQL